MYRVSCDTPHFTFNGTCVWLVNVVAVFLCDIVCSDLESSNNNIHFMYISTYYFSNVININGKRIRPIIVLHVTIFHHLYKEMYFNWTSRKLFRSKVLTDLRIQRIFTQRQRHSYPQSNPRYVQFTISYPGPNQITYEIEASFPFKKVANFHDLWSQVRQDWVIKAHRQYPGGLWYLIRVDNRLQHRSLFVLVKSQQFQHIVTHAA